MTKHTQRQQNKEKEKIVYTSFFEKNGKLYEQVMHEQYGNCFAIWDGTNVTYLQSLKDGGTTYLPILDDTLKEGAVLLPTAAEPFDSIPILLEEIEQHIKRYSDLGEQFIQFGSWYPLLTAVYDKLNTVPYLRLLGDTGTGKSRVIDCIGRICYKPMLATACITPAPIYRMIKKWGGTLILEESDIKYSDETNEVVKILNAGFEKGKPVLRSTKDNPDNIQALPVFCPKIFATRKRFQDAALEARCLTEIMQETTREDIPPLLPKGFYEEEQHIRNKLLMFRFKYRNTISSDAVLTIDFGGLEPRLRQVAASFAVIFANFPEVLNEFRRLMDTYQVELVEQRSMTFEGGIVRAIFEILADNVTNVTNETNVTAKTAITASDIADKMLDFNGKQPDSRKVGRTLKILGLPTTGIKIEGKTKRMVSLKTEKLKVLAKRYIPKDDDLQEIVTMVTLVTSNGEIIGTKEQGTLDTSLHSGTSEECNLCHERPARQGGLTCQDCYDAMPERPSKV